MICMLSVIDREFILTSEPNHVTKFIIKNFLEWIFGLINELVVPFAYLINELYNFLVNT